MQRNQVATGIISIVCLLACRAAGIEVHVDFQPASGPIAPGYTAVTNTNRWDNSTSVDLGSGVRGAWLDYFGASTRDRGAAYPDPLTRDFMLWTGSNTAETFQLRGLQTGIYDLKIYSTDPQYNDTRTRFDIDQNNDSVIDQTVTIEAPLSEKTKTVSVAVSAAGVLSITVNRIGAASGVFCGLDLVATGPNPSSPSAITNLAVTGQTLTQATLTWTAPADDGGTGVSAASYDVRWSVGPIDDTNWATAGLANGEPAPASPGTQQTFIVRGLACDTTYYFAVKSSDAASNVSPLSNVISAKMQAPSIPPARDLALRVAYRTFPSVFQAWNIADNMAPEDPLDTIARHDLYWHAPTAMKLAWDTAAVGTYVLLADGFTDASISKGLQYRADLLSRNPNMILLAEIRQYEAIETSLPADHPWWLRDASGNRILGWTGGTGTYYLLDLANPSLQDHVAVHARAAVKSGVFDGVFLDCWTEFQYATARLAMVQKVRAAIGNDALIIVNPNHNKIPVTGPYINGLFMECYDTSTPAMWATIADTLVWAEANLKPEGLRVNCLESWYHVSRDDLDLMRATTTLSLTRSNGYCLFSDPNDLPAGDHLHNWYPFWDANLGKAVQAGTSQPGGGSRREFTCGTAIYNPIGNTAPVVAFAEPRTSAATGLVATTHIVAAGGDVFLLPAGMRQMLSSDQVAIVVPVGDVEGDGHVDVIDLLYFIDSFGLSLGDAAFDPRGDFNDDSSVDVVDLLLMVENWGI